jgi:DNA-binding HxlR family transcriptional regulator
VKKTTNTDIDARDRRLDELSRAAFDMDDVCSEIWLTLMAYERLRFNDLHKRLKQFGTDISKPALLDHLKHLIERKLIERREEGFQTVSYGLTDEIRDLLHVPQEDVEEWFNETKRATSRLPAFLRPLKIDKKEFYGKMSDEQLEKEIERDIARFQSLNLYELKNYIRYDLKLDKSESDSDFWQLVGNPLYRLIEKSIAENCRASERYRKTLFEKIERQPKE